ncbi:RNA polymerase sigma factor [Demequina sp. SO4-18]|uniref:RNA polymerase sigma factor n=1 Tax=Demequina sp. SO4-18 TaxID=3401026 RepID=UPI003B5BD602
MSAWARTLDQLMRERAAALFGYAYVLTGNADDAEDLLQDALVRTFRSGKRIGTLDSTHAYVKRAISTTFIDRHRRASARPSRDRGDDGDYSLARASAAGPDHAGRVDAQLDLHAAILTLPPRERACVVLRYLDDLPVAGVASELGLAVGTVKRYLSDAVARLREVCADVDFDTPESIPVDAHFQGGR